MNGGILKATPQQSGVSKHLPMCWLGFVWKGKIVQIYFVNTWNIPQPVNV